MGMYMNTPIIASSVRMNEIANTQFSTVPLRHRLVYPCRDSLTEAKDLSFGSLLEQLKQERDPEWLDGIGLGQ